MSYYVIRRRAPNNSDELLHYGTKGMKWGQKDEYIPGQGWVGNGISSRHGLKLTRVPGSSDSNSGTNNAGNRITSTNSSSRSNYQELRNAFRPAIPKDLRNAFRSGPSDGDIPKNRAGMSPTASRIRAIGEKIELGDGKKVRVDKIDANTVPSVEDLYKVWQFLSDDQKSMIQSKIEEIKKKQAKKKELHRMHIQQRQGPGEKHNSKFT